MGIERPIPVLFVHFGENWIRGSERVLLDVLASLDRSRYRPFLWCNTEAMAAEARTQGVEASVSSFAALFAYMPAPGGVRALIRQMRQARTLIRRHGIELVHVNSGAPAQWIVPAAKLSGVPVMVHLHIAYNVRERHALLLHQADALVGVAQATLRDLATDGVPASRLHVIENGVNLARLAAMPPVSHPAPGSPFTLVSVGSLIPRKGHDVTLRALRKLAASGVHPHLVIAGSGPEEQSLRILAESLGLSSQVTFLGERPDGAAYVRDVADAFVLASRDEAMPLTLLEAGSFGKACIATAVGGVREVIADGTNGLVIPPDDVDALADAIGRLFADTGLRARLGSALRDDVRQSHSTERMMLDITRVYEALLSARRSSALRRLMPRCLPSYMRYGGSLLGRKMTVTR